MSQNSTIFLEPVLPAQKIPNSQKTEEWGKQCIDGIISMGNAKLYNGRSTKYNKQVNYNLVNSIFDEQDFEYVLNPYGVKDNVGGQPARLNNWNLITPKINLLKGEEIKRPFSFRVIGVNGEVVNEIEKKQQEKMLENFNLKLQSDLAKQGIGEQPLDEQGNPVEPQQPEQIKKWINQSYQDVREQMANQVLEYLKHKERLELKFNEGYEHALIAAEEIYFVGLVAGQPSVRVVNPLYFDYDKNPDLKTIEDANWAREERWMSPGQILDEFGEYLTDDQVERIDKGLLGFNFSSNAMFPEFAYKSEDINPILRKQQTNYHNTSSHILVVTTVWKSMTKIGFLNYTDENGEKQSTIVEQGFKLTPELISVQATLEWRWIPEVWEGTKIGNDFYVNIGPRMNQHRSMDNPGSCKLPYVGRVYNNMNATATSLVDYLKPHQYLYNIIWYRMEHEIAKASGKKFVMDIAQIPRSQGIDMDKWIYYFNSVGIAFINSFEEGTEGSSVGKTSNFNQFTSVDMSLSQSMGQYINILSKIEQMAEDVSGITRQRQGQISTSETVGGVERSVAQSAAITEIFFYYHNEVKRQVLTQLLEEAKLAFYDSKKITYIVDDIYRHFIDVDGEKFNDSDYGVFLTNSSKDNAAFEAIKGLAQVALQTDKARLSDIITIYKSNSLSEVSNIIKQGEAEKQARDGQAQESQQQSAMQIEQMRQEAQERQFAFEAEQNQLDRENKIQVEQLKALGFAKETDVNQNQVPDVLEQGKLALEQSKASNEVSIKALELDIKKKDSDNKLAIEQEKLKLKNKELDIKAQDSENKLKIAKENKTKSELNRKK